MVDVWVEEERRAAVREYPAPERIEIRWRKRQGRVNCLMANIRNRDDNKGRYGELLFILLAGLKNPRIEGDEEEEEDLQCSYGLNCHRDFRFNEISVFSSFCFSFFFFVFFFNYQLIVFSSVLHHSH